jgi:hypothetical protein
MEVAEDPDLHALPPSDDAASCRCSSESGAFSAGVMLLLRREAAPAGRIQLFGL